MTRPTPVSQVVADDLLIDRVASRRPAGDDPIAGLLAALAEHADRPLGRARTRRRYHSHRLLSTLAAVTIGASGASVAAAVTVPHGPPSAAPARVAPAPDRAGSALGAELVRDATGRVTVVGADGTRVESAWLPDGVGPVLLSPATDFGRALGADVSRYRWQTLGGPTALLLAGPDQDLESPDPDGVSSTANAGPEHDGGTGLAEEAATPADAAAATAGEPASDPESGAADSGATAATPSDDATTATTPSDDATDQSAGTDQSDATPSEPGETGSDHAGMPADIDTRGEVGMPAHAGEPGRPSGADDAGTLPPQAQLGSGVPATDAPIPTAPASSVPGDDGGLVAVPTIPVMVPLATLPVAVLADPS